MAKKIKGIVVRLGGDTSGLTKALSDADKALAATQREINDVQKALKLDPSNTVLLAQKQELLTKAIADTSSKLRTLEDNAEKAKKAFEANGEWERQFAPLKEKIDAAKKSLSELKDKQKEAEKEFAAGNISAEDYEKIQTDVKSAEKALADLNEEKKKLDAQFADGHITAEEYRTYQREVESTRAHLQGLQTELKNMSTVSEEQRQKITQFGEHAKQTFAGVVKAVAAITAALIAVGKQAVETGAAFDSSMSEVAATLGYSWDELIDSGSEAAQTMEQLREFALDLGKSTAFSAKEASDGLQYMALAGMDAAESIEMLPKVLDLASSAGMELGKSSDMVTDAMSALGLSADETTIMIDQMAKTASRSNTSVEQLGEAILTIGATGKDVAGGTKELATVLGLLADNGIKASEGGTKARNIILALEAPTDKAAAALENLGVSAFDADGHFRPLQDTFADLGTALSGLSEQDAAIAKSTIFSKRDLAAVNALLNTSAERWNELGDEIENSAGAAHAMAEVKLDNLAGDITLFKSAMEGAQITISDKLTPALRNAVQFGTEAVGKLADGFGQGGLSGAVAAAHKLIESTFREDAGAIFGVEAALQGVISAFVTYKATMLLTEGIAALKTVNTLLTEGKTLTEALNAAQMANPYVLIATLAIGAGTAIKKLIDIQTDLIDETSDSYDKLNEEQKKVVDSTEELAKAVSDAREEYKKSTDEIEDYADSSRELVEQMYKLNAREKLSKGEKEALRAIVEKLNSSYKGLNIKIDETTGKLITEKKAIEDVIAAKEQEDKANEASKRYTEVVGQLEQAERNRANAAVERERGYRELGNLMVELSKKQQELDGFLANAGGESYWSDEQVKKYAALREGINITNDAISDQKDKLGELNTAFIIATETARTLRGENDELIETMGGVEEATEEASESLDDIADSADNAAKAVGISFEELQDKVDTTVSEIEARIKEYEDKLASRTGTLQSWFEVNATVSGEDASFAALSNTLNKQIAAMDKWSKDIERLEKEGINENFLDRLKDAGPQSQELVRSLLSVSPEQRQAYADKWFDAYEGAAKTAEKQLARMKQETENTIGNMIEELKKLSPDFAEVWKTLGGDAIDGYIEGLRDGTKLEEVKAAVKEMVDAALEATADEQRSASPAKETEELGGDYGEGYVVGIEGKISEAVNAAKKMVSQTLQATDSANSGASAATIGARIVGLNKSAAASVTAAQTTQAVPAVTIDYNKIGSAVRNGLVDLASGTFVAATEIDSDVIAKRTYRKIDVLIGQEYEKSNRSYA